MAKVEKRTATLDAVLVDAAITEVRLHAPPFMRGDVGVGMALGACIREGIAALAKQRLGEDADVSGLIPDHVDHRSD